MPNLPLVQPHPPRLSTMSAQLAEIEARGIYSNGGPVVRGFERDVTGRLFAGRGDSLAVGSATLGLMLALRHAAGARANRGALALVPAMTFAATAHAAVWAGMTPLVCDVDPATWAIDPAAEEALLRRNGDRIAVIVPYAPFGRSLDLDRYQWLTRRHGVKVVIDAAASLGCRMADGANFGAGAPMAVVYSMHATKTFATGEGGLVHSGDAGLIEDLRAMANFGFGAPRSATMPGLNAKLSEVAGLSAAARLQDIDRIADHRAMLGEAYRSELPEFPGQAPDGARQTYQFWSLLLPEAVAPQRDALIAALGAEGIGAGHYFSPHLGQQPYFRAEALIEPTPVADAIGARILSLPITDRMTRDDVAVVAAALRRAIAALRPARKVAARPAAPVVYETVIIGGGPAGTALLTAAAKRGQLGDIAPGLALVEAGPALGAGNIGGYAIRSDTTAETFLSAVKGNAEPGLAALADHPAAARMATHIGQPGAPLAEAADLLAVTGDRLGQIVADRGGTVLTSHRAIAARRTAAGCWQVTVSDAAGATRDLTTRHVVIATGGRMCADAVRAAPIGGSTLGDLAGERLMTADAVMRHDGIATLAARLGEARAPRIAVIGGSTSALASVVRLLKADPALPLGAGAITVLHRRPLRPFYPSRQAALADGFTDFTDADICPVSGFVYRLAGFRLESRDLVLRMLGIGGRAPDPRVALMHLAQHDAAEAARVIAGADVVIGATGYRPLALPLFDTDGTPIALACDAPRVGPMVDRHCRVMAADDSVVPGVFGIGLAAGFVPWGRLGGEESFRGNANGLWLWQNDVGQMIVDQILTARRGMAAA